MDVRYARHIALPDFAEPGQARIEGASALVVGLGGLGCPAVTYLAASGVGRITLNDFDRVDASNLQRQVLFSTGDIGKPKAAAAARRLAELNPGPELTAVEERLQGDALVAAVAAHDVVLDCSDNFGTRFAVNAACVATGTDLVSGAAIRYEGQLAVFRPADTDSPCYRCLYDEADEDVEDCRGNGILGPVAGVVGAMMAAEALKLIAGVGQPAVGRLLLYDGGSAMWRSATLRRDPGCPVCGGTGP